LLRGWRFCGGLFDGGRRGRGLFGSGLFRCGRRFRGRLLSRRGLGGGRGWRGRLCGRRRGLKRGNAFVEVGVAGDDALLGQRLLGGGYRVLVAALLSGHKGLVGGLEGVLGNSGKGR
jgi:hypothetical protein